MIPRAEWTAGLSSCGGLAPAWTSSGTPRPALDVPLDMLMVHYAGSPDGGGFLSMDPLDYVRGMYAWSFGAGERGDEYNYVIAGLEGEVYEWAGDHRAAHCTDWNDASIGVQFGLDVDDEPPDIYAERLMALRLELVERGVLTPGHHVDQHGQHFGTACPGQSVKARWNQYDRPLTMPEETPVPFLIAVVNHPGYDPATRVVYITDWLQRRWVQNEAQLNIMLAAGVAPPELEEWAAIDAYGTLVGPSP